jgi:hypothetical protein
MILIIANVVTALALGGLYWAVNGIGAEFALGLWLGGALGIWACRNPENPFTTPLNAETRRPE